MSANMGLEVVLHGGSRPVAAHPVDVSLGGLGLRVPSSEASCIGGAHRLSLRWSDQTRECAVGVVHADSTSSGAGDFVRVGARFRQADAALLGALCQLFDLRDTPSAGRPDVLFNLASGEGFQETSEPRRIRRFLAYCCGAGKELTVHDPVGKLAGRFVPNTFSATSVSGTFSTISEVSHPFEPRHLVLPTFNGLSVLTVSGVQLRDATAAFNGPFHLHQGALRRHGRLRASQGAALSVELLHPEIPGLLVSRTLRDFSLGGFSIVIQRQTDLLLPGTRLDCAMLRLPDGRSIAFRGIVRHTFEDEQRLWCAGIELLDFAETGRSLWIRTVTEWTNPQVKEARAGEVGDLWRVFKRSGYLQEKPADGMRELRRAYLRTWRRLLSHDTAAKTWVYHGATCPLGTVSASQIYRNTWLIHHLGVDRELRPEKKLAALAALIHRALIPWFIASRPPKNMLLFTDSSSSFNKKAWFDFLEPRRKPDTVSMKRFLIRELSTDGWQEAAPPDDIRVEQADPDLLELVSRHLRAADGELAWRTLDLRADLIAANGRSGFHPALDRSRDVFVARLDHTVLGFALVESATAAANVFRLYDTCRIVLLGDEGMTAPGERAYDLLLTRAASYFRQRGSQAFLQLCDPDRRPSGPDGCFETEGVRAVVTPELFPQWIDYLDDLWVRR